MTQIRMKNKRGDPAMKILVTDDDCAIRDTMHQLLSYQGHDVGLACDGHECLETLGSSAYDVLFLDVMMPGLDGMAVARKLKNVEGRPKIVFLTVKPIAELDMRLADSFVQKPFEIEDVLKELE